VQLKPNDIVTCMDRDSFFYERQGVVRRVQLRLLGEDPEVAVFFDKESCVDSLRREEWENGAEEIFSPGLLRRDDDWEPRTYADRLFSRCWHTVRVVRKPPDPELPCQVEGCCSKQERVIWVNIWGTVLNTHVCDDHAEQFHGCRLDSFPWRKEASAA
jgi:hypothetical protein